MKILYTQPSNTDGVETHLSFEQYGIENCYLKLISAHRENSDITKKRHSHTSYEIHIVEEGCQTYDTDDRTYKVSKGQFLLIPPNLKHKIISTEYPIKKFALEFKLNITSPLSFENYFCVYDDTPAYILESMQRIVAEYKTSLTSSELLIANRVFESALLLLRLANAKESAKLPAEWADMRISFAKQYIKDNIESPLLVSDIAAYCYVSEKQLTRLFKKYEDISPAMYIKKEKIKHIEMLLTDDTLSLKEISDRMCFPNEYYFNVFFKKYYGMPPGQYRKMF